MDLKSLICELTSLVTVSGCEYLSEKRVRELVMPYFDEYHRLSSGSFVFVKRAGQDREKAKVPTLLIDAHIDEIGFMVSSILEGGFVKVVPLGGIDTKVMQASELLIYGSAETVRAVVASTPPHLQKKGDQNKSLKVNELILDTGYDKESLEKLISVGDPAGFIPDVYEIANSRLVGKGFDNKSTAAIAVYAVSKIEKSELDCDVVLLLSSQEETNMSGARTGAYDFLFNISGVCSDDENIAAIVTDVGFASQPDTKPEETRKLGQGPVLSFSVVTDRSLTQAIWETANGDADKDADGSGSADKDGNKDAEFVTETVTETVTESGNKDGKIKLQKLWEPLGTGTNADGIAISGAGIPTAVLSLPIKNMHTYSELLDLSDAEAMAELLKKFICGGFTKWINQQSC